MATPRSQQAFLNYLQGHQSPTFDYRNTYEPAESAYGHSQAYHVYEESLSQDQQLDAYDRSLLSEPYPDRAWQASQGLARLSLPRPGHQVYLTEDNDVFTYQPWASAPSPFQQPRIHHASHPIHYTTPSRHVVTESSSPFFNAAFSRDSSSPTARISRQRSQRQYRGQRSAAADTVHQLPRPRSSHLELARNAVQNRQIPTLGAAPIVQGVQLVPVSTLPDRFRVVFPYNLFNAVQSRCYPHVYETDYNFVMSAPTGSGKTVILELAVCRLIAAPSIDAFKVVYMAPTKSLCSERKHDWESKFRNLGLSVQELTGDTAASDGAQHVQQADIIITTPEKWDSITRKWKDHKRLMMLVKLLLIDEVHMLGDNRGATLEAVVSRIKSMNAGTRFIALSATVPNAPDVAEWLGRSPDRQDIPALMEVFGEDFRPVRLEKHVVALKHQGNDFQLDQICDKHLPTVIAKYTCRKPIMIFCWTRKSCVATAKMLKDRRTIDAQAETWWPIPRHSVNVSDADLNDLLTVGVAYHHAGIDTEDRTAIERGYLSGQVFVICCTSTLAVGVNLPCHLVIIKNTVAYQDEGTREYSDLEIMQMLGRAGRPQFATDGAVAVILTSNAKKSKYQRLVSGEQTLESCFHLNLVEHMNAEIGLGTVIDLPTARKWLESTFLHVRMKKNPAYYKLKSGTKDSSLDHCISAICQRDIDALVEAELVIQRQFLECTAFGEAMTRYYVDFETMRVFLAIPERAKISEILSSLVQAHEFHDIRLRQNEKGLYKSLNAAIGIKFPIKDITTAIHKRSIIIQAELGSVEALPGNQLNKGRYQYNHDRAVIFNNVHRLIRCIIDCKIHLRDAVAVRNALELARSLSARVWDSGPLQLKQIPSVGPVTVRKLVQAGISTLDGLVEADPARINMVLGRLNMGEKLVNAAKDFPRLRITISMVGHTISENNLPNIRFKVEAGFLNDSIPQVRSRKPVYVCFIAERSDNFLIDFRRMSATKLGEPILLSSELENVQQHIICYVMCDDLAGTLRSAELKPNLSANIFPSQRLVANISTSTTAGDIQKATMNSSKKRSCMSSGQSHQSRNQHDGDLFDLDDIDDADFLAAENQAGFQNLEDVEAHVQCHDKQKEKQSKIVFGTSRARQRSDGRYECNHSCKDKTACRHLCCREGLDRPPKPPRTPQEDKAQAGQAKEFQQSTLNSTTLTRDGEFLDKKQQEQSKGSRNHGPPPKRIKKQLDHTLLRSQEDTLDLTKAHFQDGKFNQARRRVSNHNSIQMQADETEVVDLTLERDGIYVPIEKSSKPAEMQHGNELLDDSDLLSLGLPQLYEETPSTSTERRQADTLEDKEFGKVETILSSDGPLLLWSESSPAQQDSESMAPEDTADMASQASQGKSQEVVRDGMMSVSHVEAKDTPTDMALPTRGNEVGLENKTFESTAERPFRDMQGIDINLYRELSRFVNFVDD